MRHILFSLDAERAHTLSEHALRIPLVWKSFGLYSGIGDERLRADVAGLQMPSPVGLAAGLDKNCVNLCSLLDLGFGFATGGTITLSARLGNPKPRVLRLPESRALINSLGFPGDGLERIESRLRNRRLGNQRRRVLISISGTIEDEIVECHRRVAPLVAGIELNISSPNTSGLRVFHDPARLRDLVDLLRRESDADKPLLVKLPPWTADSDDRKRSIALAETAVSAGASGLVIANTMPIEDSRLAVGKGGLSGAPLLENTVRMTAEVSALLGRDAAVISCGGISTPEDVWRMLASGASAVQLYTALVYEGPGLPGTINRGLLNMMERAGIESLYDIAGQPLPN